MTYLLITEIKFIPQTVHSFVLPGALFPNLKQAFPKHNQVDLAKEKPRRLEIKNR